MRLLKLLIAFLLIAGPAHADSSKDSEVVSDIYVKLTWNQDGDVLSSSDKIVYGFFCTNAQARPTIVFPKAEFFCHMELKDAKGSNIAPVNPDKCGTRFLELTNYSYEIIDKRPNGGSDTLMPRFQNLHSDMAAYLELPAPEKAFYITNSGRYMLRCEFQVFKQIQQGTSFTYSLIRVPPLYIPVIKN